MLLEHLPADSALGRALDPDRHHEWNEVVSHLLVAAVHELRLLRFMWADESSRGAPPEPIPMPWETASRRQADESLVAQLRANETT